MAEIKTLHGNTIQLNQGDMIAVEIVYEQDPTNAVVFVEGVREFPLEQYVRGSIYKDGALGEIAFFYCVFGENGIKHAYEPLPTIIKTLDDQALLDKARDSYFEFLHESTECRAQIERDMKALFGQKKLERVV